MLLFFSLRGVPDLCPKARDLGVKPLAPFCPPALPLTWSSKLSKLIVREPSPGRVTLVSVKTQTESQTAQVAVQTTPVSVQLQTTLVSIETQTIEVREAQTAKTKGEI